MAALSDGRRAQKGGWDSGLELAHTAAAGRQAEPLRHLARVESQPVPSRHRAVRRVRHRDRRVATQSQPRARLPGGLPYQPWAAALAKERAADDSRDDPHVRCLPDNPPRAWTLPHLTKAIHTPKLLVLLYEVNAMYRQIFIDGRPLPEDPTPGWNGYSTARWDGDTLVVQTAGFRDNLWIDMGGSPMSDAAKMTERIRRPNYGSSRTGDHHRRSQGLHPAIHDQADAEHRDRHGADRRVLSGEREVVRADAEISIGEVRCATQLAGDLHSHVTSLPTTHRGIEVLRLD